MALSNTRKHLINRLKALTENVGKMEENFAMDKMLDRMITKLEKKYGSQQERKAYRKALSDKRAAALVPEPVLADPEEEISEEEALAAQPLTDAELEGEETTNG